MENLLKLREQAVGNEVEDNPQAEESSGMVLNTSMDALNKELMKSIRQKEKEKEVVSVGDSLSYRFHLLQVLKAEVPIGARRLLEI